MDKKTLQGLQQLNQLKLSDEDETLAFFQTRENEWAALDSIDTSDVARMVHVTELPAAIREDVVDEPFDRDDLQDAAPEAVDGYWAVPYVLE